LRFDFLKAENSALLGCLDTFEDYSTRNKTSRTAFERLRGKAQSRGWFLVPYDGGGLGKGEVAKLFVNDSVKAIIGS
jgi:hypothetical protein